MAFYDPTMPVYDTSKSVDHLNWSFSTARREYMSATREKSVKARYAKTGTKIYEYEVSFCYLINEIQNGPVYMIAKNIADANELIRDLQSETA